MDAVSRAPTARRALLAVLLWVGFWAMALTLVGALAWIPLAQGMYAGAPSLSGLLAGAAALTLLWALRPRGLFQRQEAAPEPLPRERHAALYALVDDVARRVGTRPVRKVHLAAGANASIHLERRWLGLVREPVVTVGLPLFALLSREELASVLAHEYGHHVGGDLALGPWVYRTRASLAAAVDALEDSAFFLDVPFRAYGQLFLRVSGAVSRQQELAADALAARVCGVQATTSALRKVRELGDRWQAYLHGELVPLVERGARLPVLEGWRRFDTALRERPGGPPPFERPAPGPGDSHPPLEERLRALGAGPEGTAESGECLALLGDEAAADALFYERFIQGELRSVGWDEVARALLLPELEKQLAQGALDPSRLSPSALPALLREGAALWERVRPPGVDLLSAEARRRQARVLLAQWLAVALAQRGFTPTLAPGARLSLQRGEERVEPFERVEQVASGALPEADYLAWCASLEAPSAQSG